MFELRNITKRYPSNIALNNVSLSIPKGEVFGIVGPNGAGKSTLFKIIAGLLHPDKGTARPSPNTPFPSIAYKPDRVLFPNRVSATNYLRMVADLANLPRDRKDAAVFEALERVSLSEAANKPLGSYSKGMRQRAAFAQTLIGDPDLLLLDEPTNGLDPSGQQDIKALISQLHANGKTILISSHQLEHIASVCTQLVIINKGKLVYQSSMADALAMRPHLSIEVDKDLLLVEPQLRQIHPEIISDGFNITLSGEAITYRRQILTLLLGAGFDILHLEHHQTTLAELYNEKINA